MSYIIDKLLLGSLLGRARRKDNFSGRISAFRVSIFTSELSAGVKFFLGIRRIFPSKEKN
jgi:hypothetical protein